MILFRLNEKKKNKTKKKKKQKKKKKKKQQQKTKDVMHDARSVFVHNNVFFFIHCSIKQNKSKFNSYN